MVLKNTAYYLHPPIKEAILDIQVELPENINLKNLKKTDKKYPILKELKETTGLFTIGDLISASASSQIIGYNFKKENNENLYQFRMNGFSFHHLDPYENWKNFQKEANKIWISYNQKFNPVKIKRIALRYINLINIPEKQFELKEYFTITPEIPNQLPQIINNFLINIIMPLKNINGNSSITQTIIKPKENNSITVSLDIDVFVENNLQNNNEYIFETFNKLRNEKNNIFESFITDKTRELFK